MACRGVLIPACDTSLCLCLQGRDPTRGQGVWAPLQLQPDGATWTLCSRAVQPPLDVLALCREPMQDVVLE